VAATSCSLLVIAHVDPYSLEASSTDKLAPMKLLYKPFGIVFGILSGLISRRLFEALWGLIDDEKPPTATTLRTTWPKVLIAAALEAVAFKVTRAVVDRVGAQWFSRLTGSWPGDLEPEQE